jgi:hypothetical protein
MSEKRATVGNASDPRQTRAGRRLIAWRERRNDSDLAAVLSTIEGRRVVWRILGADFLKLYETDIGVTDAETNRNAGRRNVALKLYAEVTQKHPDALLLMQSEAITEQTQTTKDEPLPDPDVELRTEDTRDAEASE